MAELKDGERLLTIPLVQHGGHRFPADVELEPSADRYVGFYENQHGEQLVFVHERGEQPKLYHGDYGWAPLAASWPEMYESFPTLIAPWVTGELILNQGEVLWLAACLHASGSLREGEDTGEGPLDRLLMQRIEDGSKRQHDNFDRQWSLREKALDRWREKRETPPTSEEDRYAEGAILVLLGLNAKQRRPRVGVTKDIRERIEREAAEAVQEVQK